MKEQAAKQNNTRTKHHASTIKYKRSYKQQLFSQNGCIQFMGQKEHNIHFNIQPHTTPMIIVVDRLCFDLIKTRVCLYFVHCKTTPIANQHTSKLTKFSSLSQVPTKTHDQINSSGTL
jgi:hypothetical protein